MLIYFGSPAHISALLLAACGTLLCYALLRGRSLRVKLGGVFFLMLVNLFQHFYKPLVWPHLWGSCFGLINTAYNVCAFMIILSPVALLSGSDLLKNFTAIVGTACGVAIVFPTWFYGQTPFQWEFLRAWLCHALLVTTSLLLPALDLTRFERRNAFKIGGLAIAGLCLVLLDNVLCYALGLIGGTENESLAQTLYRLNPLWMMAPPEGFDDFLLRGLHALMPFHIVVEGAPRPVPILWYALPLFVVVSLISAVVSSRKRRYAPFKT